MQRNVIIIVGVFLFACMLLLLLLWGWWTLLAPATAPPTATVASSFVTATSPSGGTDTTSPTPTIIVPVSSPSSTATPTLSPTTPPTPTNSPSPILATPTPPATYTPSSPYAVINSPNGFVNIRSGPGVIYEPALGTYQNGITVPVLGKQYSIDGKLWWLISFPSGPYGKGWIYAPYTNAHNVSSVPWVAAPPTPTPVYVTPSATPKPYGIINSPDSFLYVRSGPGKVYQPPLGTYSNGTRVNILGKQLATNGALWWLVPFVGGFNGQGWLYADYTLAYNTDNVPWIAAPPTPTLVATRTPTPTPTLDAPSVVNWTITGWVIDATTAQPVGNASVQARLGNDGTVRSTLTNSNGEFSIMGSAQDSGDLILTIKAFGYEEKTIRSGAVKPRVYDFPNISLVPQQAPLVTWIILGRVVEIGTYQPVPNAQVKALLGDDTVQLNSISDSDGEFTMEGQARDSGTLSLTITANGYQPYTYSSPQTDSRIYNLPDMTLVPLADSCAYESVISLVESAALARLQNLKFTNVSTTSIVVEENSGLVDRVISQYPDPPPEGQSIRLSCQLPIMLGVGVKSEE